MNTTQKLNVEAVREWIASTLSKNDLVRPDGRWLFAYDLSKADFEELEQLIKDSCHDTGGFSHLVSRRNAFSALFVFYAAEWWKHNYDGGAWDWSPIVESLGGDDDSFPPQLRSECVTLGLRYWGHIPLAQGKRFIGAIAAHGGIPMKLLAQGTGRLSLVLEQVLKQAGRYNWNALQIQECVEQYQHQLPAAYRRPEISNLFTRFIETILQLKSEFQLSGRIDPIAYLDSQAPGWRRRFPISLEVDAAQTLLVGLVREASLIKASSSSDYFRCERRLIGDKEHGSFSIESVVTHSSRLDADLLANYFGLKGADELPRYMAIDLEVESRQNFIEGRFVLGASAPTVSLVGRKLSLKGTVALMEHRLVLRDHAKDYSELVTTAGGGAIGQDDPWVFVKSDDGILRFIAAGSARVQTQTAIIAIPSGWKVLCEDESDALSLGVLEVGNSCRQVLEVSCTALLCFDDLEYRVRVGQSLTSIDLYQWSGARLPEAFGKQVFRDKVPPRLYRADEDALVKVPLADQRWMNSGSQNSISPKEACGPIDVVISSEGEVTGRQKIFVLPETARIQFVSGETVGTGLIRFVNWGAIEVSAQASDDFTCRVHKELNSNICTLSLSTSEVPPSEIKCFIKWLGSPSELILHLPYPVTGGRFIRGNLGVLTHGSKVSVRELIGLRLQVFDTNPSNPKAYALQICMGSGSREISERHAIKLDLNGRADVRLIDYQSAIESLLGLSDELDASVRVNLLVGNVKATEIHIARFMCILESDIDLLKLPDDFFASLGVDALRGLRVLASQLIHPSIDAIELLPVESDGALTGGWRTDSLDPSLSPWFIYPAVDSTIHFRPRIWAEAPKMSLLLNTEEQKSAVCPLSTALSIADASDRWSELHNVLDSMSSNFSHESWSLLHALWESFNHLPLSALDVWKMLGKHSKSLLAFIMVSPMSDHELTAALRRFRDETGWTPELTTLDDWRAVISTFWTYWSNQLSADLAKTIFLSQLQSRLNLVKNEFYGLELMLDFLSFEITNSPSPSLVVIGAQSTAKVEIRLKELWTGGESLVNAYLFTSNSDRENWPGRGFFQEAFEAFIENVNEDGKLLLSPWFTRLFWFQPGDFKMSVANMPMMCALWATTSTSRQWWGNPKNRLMIRRIRDFDPVWFEQCFRQSCAVLLSISGLIKPQSAVELPA
jgi:hypothetical protein